LGWPKTALWPLRIQLTVKTAQFDQSLSVYISTGRDHRFLASYPANLFVEVRIKGAM
jgi:hypothetical protein